MKKKTNTDNNRNGNEQEKGKIKMFRPFSCHPMSSCRSDENAPTDGNSMLIRQYTRTGQLKLNLHRFGTLLA